MTRIKVRDGTPVGNVSLCTTCRNGHTVKTGRLHTIVICTKYSMDGVTCFPQPVVECSEYDDKRMPSKWDMEAIAWTIQTRNRGPAGFQGSETEIEIVPPKKKDDE